MHAYNIKMNMDDQFQYHTVGEEVNRGESIREFNETFWVRVCAMSERLRLHCSQINWNRISHKHTKTNHHKAITSLAVDCCKVDVKAKLSHQKKTFFRSIVISMYSQVRVVTWLVCSRSLCLCILLINSNPQKSSLFLITIVISWVMTHRCWILYATINQCTLSVYYLLCLSK